MSSRRGHGSGGTVSSPRSLFRPKVVTGDCSSPLVAWSAPLSGAPPKANGGRTSPPAARSGRSIRPTAPATSQSRRPPRSTAAFVGVDLLPLPDGGYTVIELNGAVD